LVTLPKTCWLKVLDSVVIQLYSSECTPSVDRALLESLKKTRLSLIFTPTPSDAFLGLVKTKLKPGISILGIVSNIMHVSVRQIISR